MAITNALTLEDFLKLPEAEPALEYFDGTVTQKVSPKGRHSWLQSEFAAFVNRFTMPRGLGIAFVELRATFAGGSPVPDIAVYLWERIPWAPGGEVPDDFSEPPDVAVEILSPGQTKSALMEKCARYVANGVPLTLLVDPDDESVTRFRPGEAPTALRGADVIDFAPVLPGLRLRLRTLFGWLRPARRRRQRP